ncbi:MAG: ester cyclase [Deltaproteobacteria bacterium]|nr:ester cyclase [Deltaproteobacteria bacterium]
MSQNITKMTKDEFIAYAVKTLQKWEGDDIISPWENYAEDVVYTDASRLGKKTFRNRKEHMEEFTQPFLGLSDLKLEVQDAVAEGNRVVVLHLWSALHDKGPFDGIPPTGKRLKCFVTSWMWFNDDGKIIRQVDVYNRETIAQQLCDGNYE